LTEETLTDYLEGGLDPAVKAASEVHLLACDECRKNLAYFMRLLDPDVAPDEAGVLKTMTAAWPPKPAPGRWTGTALWTLFTLAAALIISVSVFAVRFMVGRSAAPKSAGEIVHLLLEQKRPFEARLANEPYLKFVATRGTAEPGISYGPLSVEMTKLSASGHEMGRFHLLQKDLPHARQYLEIAEKEPGAGAAVHNDLGVAYLEIGDPEQLDSAAREFQHALVADPSFATAIFNLALFWERKGDMTQALAEWQRYLSLDSNSNWALEARARIQELSR
jgi:tetratricopeptide (TPR) repeat protein